MLDQTHYLPHQAVIRSDALTTKLRVVFDASAKVRPDCPSLNDCTYTGPPLTPGIADILMRFRAHKVGLVADIEKAFLNIAVDEQQRDLMRFLWIDDVRKDDPNIEIYRFCRVIFGMNCSPFLLNATLLHHVTEYYASDPALAEYILSGLYVDDLTLVVKTMTKRTPFTRQLTHALQPGGSTCANEHRTERQSFRRSQVTEWKRTIMRNNNSLQKKNSRTQRSPLVVLRKSIPPRNIRSSELTGTWEKTPSL